MSVDEQEALSVGHAHSWHFYRLRSGNYAVFSTRWGLVACVPWNLVEELYLKRDPERDKEPKCPVALPDIKINLADFGL